MRKDIHKFKHNKEVKSNRAIKTEKLVKQRKVGYYIKVIVVTYILLYLGTKFYTLTF